MPTIDGTETFQLKEGTQPNETFTLRGKGIPYLNRNNVRGDHIFRVILEVPRHLNEEQKEMLREFDGTCTRNNYQKRENFFSRIKEIFKS